MFKGSVLLFLVFLLESNNFAASLTVEEKLREYDPATTESLSLAPPVTIGTPPPSPDNSFRALSSNEYIPLSGTIPSQIGTFTMLTALTMYGNNLNGTVPSQMGKLTRLDFLLLEENLSGGNLSFIRNLRNLSYVALEGNKLSGEIPSQIGTFTMLTQVFLGENEISGSIPSEIGELIGLTLLSLHDNNLSGKIPLQISRMIALDELYLSQNKLSGEIPEQLADLPALGSVSLANNFDINCEADFLGWYVPFSEKVVDRYDISLQCFGQVYPFQVNPLFVDRNEPQNSIEISSLVALPQATNVTFRWTHPSISYIEPLPLTFSANRINETLESFKQCINFDVDGAVDQTFIEYAGFEITILKIEENINNFVYIRHCIRADDLEVNDEYFQYSTDELEPATEYEIIVRPFNLLYEDIYKFIYGPSSLIVPFKTKDDIPIAAPVNFRSLSAREDQIDLNWKDTPSLIKNGEIIEYEVHSINDDQRYKTEFRQVSITGLSPDTEYEYQVRARTSIGGFSEVYSSVLRTRTCPANMKRKNETNCFAVQGSFTVSKNEALICAVEVKDVVSGCETEESLSVETLNILEGFWRPNIEYHTEIISCPVRKFCSKKRSSNSITEPESSQCAPFHRGVFCSACDNGYVISPNDGCIECTDDIKSNHNANFIAFIVIVVMLILSCVFYVFVKAMGEPLNLGLNKFSACNDFKSKLYSVSSYTWERLGVKLRILEGFFQVMFAFRTILYVNAEINPLLTMGDLVANLNLWVILDALETHCVVDVNHYLRLVLYTLPPICLAMLISFLYVILRNEISRKERLRKSCAELFFIVTFTVYPGASKTIFDTFYCEEFETVAEDSEFIFKSALRADYRLSCAFDADGRITRLVYAVFMVLLYPVGILAIYMYYLFRKTQADHSAMLDFLTYPYKSNRYWFEAYELVRKLLQTAFVSFFLKYGTGAAASIALNLSVTFLLVLVYLNPYNNHNDFGFAIWSSCLLIFLAQLTNIEECDLECQGDIFSSLVILEILAFFFFAIIEHQLSKTKNITDLSFENAENITFENAENVELNLKEKIKELNGKLQTQDNKIQRLKNGLMGMQAKNDKLSAELSALKAQNDILPIL